MPLLPACSVFDVVNAASKIYRVDAERNLQYGEHERFGYDLYLPRVSNPDTTPVVVFFYGGSWNDGSRKEYEFVGRRLAAQGYIVAVPDYRLYPEVAYPDFLHDSAAAVAAVKKQLQGSRYQKYNPAEQLILMGHSAGAYNAAMLAMDARWLSEYQLDNHKVVGAFIGLAGPYDLYPIGIPNVQPVFFHPNYPENSNPVDFLEDYQTPTLIMAPETDELVSISQNSQRLANDLAAKGAPHQLVQVKGTDHITMIGAMSPLLFFKGNVIQPIKRFISDLSFENIGETELAAD